MCSDIYSCSPLLDWKGNKCPARHKFMTLNDLYASLKSQGFRDKPLWNLFSKAYSLYSILVVSTTTRPKRIKQNK